MPSKHQTTELPSRVARARVDVLTQAYAAMVVHNIIFKE